MSQAARRRNASGAASIGALLAIAVGCKPAVPAVAPSPRVRIEAGMIEGVAFGTSRSAAFLGIPYAAPPVGAWRWKPPRSVPAWSGVRLAHELGAACPQPLEREASNMRRLIADLGGDPSTAPRLGSTSEDCLSLNIWTPDAGATPKLPVIVWIHGGSDVVGRGGSEPASLASLGAVVVTINYRLGILGFMAHPALTRESPHSSSGNYGLLDQIAALGWVHANIEAFGGDPGRVMVAGHSAGGGAVLQLLATPLARGLFQRAISQSGTLDMSQPLADAEAEGMALARQLGVPDADPLGALRAIPIDRLLTATAHGYQGTTDGWVLPSSVPSLLQDGRMDAMPLVIGATANEAAIFGFTSPRRRSEYRQLVQRDDAVPGRLLALYPADTDDDVPAAVRRYMTDRDFVCPARYVAATRSGPTWLYLYAAPPAPGARLAAFHGAELRPLFDQTFGAPLSDAEQRIGAAMRRYWVQFARTGDPNLPGLPEWPVYQVRHPRYLELGESLHATEPLGRKGCDVFDEAWTNRRANRRAE